MTDNEVELKQRIGKGCSFRDVNSAIDYLQNPKYGHLSATLKDLMSTYGITSRPDQRRILQALVADETSDGRKERITTFIKNLDIQGINYLRNHLYRAVPAEGKFYDALESALNSNIHLDIFDLFSSRSLLEKLMLEEVKSLTINRINENFRYDRRMLAEISATDKQGERITLSVVLQGQIGFILHSKLFAQQQADRSAAEQARAEAEAKQKAIYDAIPKNAETLKYCSFYQTLGNGDMRPLHHEFYKGHRIAVDTNGQKTDQYEQNAKMFGNTLAKRWAGNRRFTWYPVKGFGDNVWIEATDVRIL